MCWERSRVRKDRNSKESGGTAETRAHQWQCEATACTFVISLWIAKLQLFPANAPQHASKLLLQHQFSVRTAHLSWLASPILPSHKPTVGLQGLPCSSWSCYFYTRDTGLTYLTHAVCSFRNIEAKGKSFFWKWQHPWKIRLGPYKTPLKITR